MPAPRTQTSRNSTGWGNGPAMSFAVKKIDEPMMPPTSKRTESSRLSPRTRLGDSDFPANGDDTEGALIIGLSHPQFVGRLERSSAASADDGRAVAASERIGHFLAAPGTVKWLRVRLRLRG